MTLGNTLLFVVFFGFSAFSAWLLWRYPDDASPAQGRHRVKVSRKARMSARRGRGPGMS